MPPDTYVLCLVFIDDLLLHPSLLQGGAGGGLLGRNDRIKNLIAQGPDEPLRPLQLVDDVLSNISHIRDKVIRLDGQNQVSA